MVDMKMYADYLEFTRRDQTHTLLGLPLEYVAMIRTYHHGQTYANEDYYHGHLFPIAMSLPEGVERYVALAHDLFEDTECPWTALEVLLPHELRFQVVQAVFALTKRPDVSYEGYINELALFGGRVARRVKIADLAFNISHTRTKHAEDIARGQRLYKKYLNALLVLGE